MQVAHVGVQHAALARDGLGDAGVGVAHARHVVVHVEESAAAYVGHPRALGAGHVDRFVVAEAFGGRAEHVAPGDEFARIGRAVVVPAQFGGEAPPADRQQLVEHGGGTGVVALGELGVFQSFGGTPRADGQADRGACRPQFADDRQFVGFERGDALVAVERESGDAQHLGATASGSERVEDRGDVDHQCGVAHVAEVDDAGDGAVGCDEGIVGGEVAVHHLGTQGGPVGGHHLLEPVERAGDQLPDGGVGDGGQHRPHLQRVLHVPRQAANGAGVDEAPHRAAETGGGGSPLDHGAVGEGGGVGAAGTGHEVVHAHPVGAIRRGPLGAVQAGVRRVRSGDGQRWVDGESVEGDSCLHVEHVGVFGCVRHLHHGDRHHLAERAHTVQQKGPVAFAAEVDRAVGLDAERRRGDCWCRGDIDRGRRSAQHLVHVPRPYRPRCLARR